MLSLCVIYYRLEICTHCYIHMLPFLGSKFVIFNWQGGTWVKLEVELIHLSPYLRSSSEYFLFRKWTFSIAQLFAITTGNTLYTTDSYTETHIEIYSVRTENQVNYSADLFIFYFIFLVQFSCKNKKVIIDRI